MVYELKEYEFTVEEWGKISEVFLTEALMPAIQSDTLNEIWVHHGLKKIRLFKLFSFGSLIELFDRSPSEESRDTGYHRYEHIDIDYTRHYIRVLEGEGGTQKSATDNLYLLFYQCKPGKRDDIVANLSSRSEHVLGLWKSEVGDVNEMIVLSNRQRGPYIENKSNKIKGWASLKIETVSKAG